MTLFDLHLAKPRPRTMGNEPDHGYWVGTIDGIDEIKNPEDREHACWKEGPAHYQLLDPLWKDRSTSVGVCASAVPPVVVQGTGLVWCLLLYISNHPCC